MAFSVTKKTRSTSPLFNKYHAPKLTLAHPTIHFATFMATTPFRPPTGALRYAKHTPLIDPQELSLPLLNT
jgi:hypothetical protein